MTFLQQGGEAAQAWYPFISLFIVFVVFYLLIIRPQQQQQKKRQKMLSELKKGDRVITVGGIHGEITAVHDDDLTLRIADKVEIRIAKAGIARLKGKE